MIAVKYGREKCVEALIKKKPPDYNICENRSTDFKRTVLHICAEYPNKSITNMLLDPSIANKRDLTSSDIYGNTPLHICAEKNYVNTYMCIKLLTMLISNKELDCLQRRNNNYLTAFHLATENEHNEMVEEILKTVSESKLSLIEYPDLQLRTSLHIAASKGTETEFLSV